LGYAFIGELEPGPAAAPPTAMEEDRLSPDGPGDARAGHASPRAWWIASLVLAAMLALAYWSRQADAPPRPAEASVAILPFANLGGGPDDDYFAEGLAVEMHDALAGVEGLKVAAQLSPASPAA